MQLAWKRAWYLMVLDELCVNRTPHELDDSGILGARGCYVTSARTGETPSVAATWPRLQGQGWGHSQQASKPSSNQTMESIVRAMNLSARLLIVRALQSFNVQDAGRTVYVCKLALTLLLREPTCPFKQQSYIEGAN